MSLKKSTFCVDTSFLIDLWVEYYPIEHFGDLWELLDRMIESGRLFAPHEVWDELANKEPRLREWCERRRKMFRKPTRIDCEHLREILKNNPGCVDKFKRGPHADALVVAMAKSTGTIAVTRERRSGADPNLIKVRIPTLCEKNGVPFVATVNEFRSAIGWKSSEGS